MKRVLGRPPEGSRSLTTGFTLVELMVALTGGLFVSIAVFMLAKQATAVYQSEARMSNATLSSVVGFDRLRADIERASFLSSPNVRRDPKLCGAPDATWPAYLSHLAGVYIEQTDTTLMPVQQGNRLTPDQITLAGSYASSDQFPTHSIASAGANHVITLEPNSGALARLGYQSAPSVAAQQALLTTVFGAGRGLRIVDTEGREQYGTIASVTGGPAPTILLLPTSPDILYRGSSATFKCGVLGNGLQHFVNVVNIVRYSLQNMTADPNYAPLFSAGPGPGAIPATDAGRTELVREELTTAGVPIPNTTEIISEFAVDMSFGATVAQVAAGASGAQLEQLVTLAPGAPVAVFAGNTTTLTPTSGGPQRIRAIRARLSVRSREADRPEGMAGVNPALIGPGLFRIGLGANGTGPFARVRTVQADIALRNHRGVTWL